MSAHEIPVAVTDTSAQDASTPRLPFVMVLQSRIHLLDWDMAVGTILGWGAARESRYVCLCNVHSVATAVNDPGLRGAINAADLALPDGMPVALAAGWFMGKPQPRIAGPDLMWRICEEAARRGLGVFLLGSTEVTLSQLVIRLKRAQPALRIVGHCSPPFAPVPTHPDEALANMINASGAALVMVALGCPKQERWMALHRGVVHGVMLGVGAAFDFHAGTMPRAPKWMQRTGIEWLHRLCSDPRRLWKRYLTSNLLFIWKLAWQASRRRGSS